jgi:brefeldin A-resistance guanine nucleotide exchange factor 1
MRFIYIKAVLQVRVLFASHDQSMRMILESSQSGSSSSKENGSNLAQSHSSISSSGAVFTIEELEIILESLADLLADLGFIPSLFASFDCDLTKGDVVQPLVKYLGACMRYTFVSEPSELALGGFQEIGALIEQCYGQLSITLNKRGRLRVAGAVDSNPTSKDDQTSNNKDVTANKDIDTENPSNWVNLSQRLKLTRLAKGVLAEAALKFSNKPQDGLKYLQSRGALPTPLTPASVAKFLRIAPGLPKESTGSFLGELGKDNPKYEADGKIFHREVLLAYVQSFELKGQTVLNCMRIFLSAFRLPGEAQQIDRILVAFSEYCHDGSIEGNNGLLENPEVTYLLTFSMIMLNTDLHNPNVRADRKMTPDQFVKNNSFYGAELNQTRPIPREYLVTIYVSLSQVPLRILSMCFHIYVFMH